MNSPSRLIVVLIAMALGGCGEFAYKTGAGADALAVDKAACHQTATYDACMHDKGWTISNLSGDDEPVAAQPAASAPAAVQPAAPGAAAVPVPAPTAPAPPEPTAPVKATAWVKFGAGNAPDTVNKTVTRALLACMRGRGWRGL